MSEKFETIDTNSLNANSLNVESIEEKRIVSIKEVPALFAVDGTEPETPAVSQPSLQTMARDLSDLSTSVKSIIAQLERISNSITALNPDTANSLEGVEEKVKEDVINYMMAHFNIKWLDDTIEKDAYEAILSIVFSLINKIV